MNQTYEKELEAIEFYQIHPEYKPFIGENYDEFKILQVGESHYIPQEKGEELVSIEYFKAHWWQENGCEELKTKCTASSEQKQWGGWYNTEGVVLDYLSGERRRGHGIFTEMVKVFSKACLDEPIAAISTESSQKYHYFAFMNFFQMPALYRGMSYWDSLLRSSRKIDGLHRKQAKEYAETVWEDMVQRSTDVLNAVIDILKPKVVIFTSGSAYEAYNQKNKASKKTKMIQTVHHSCKYWYKPNPDQNGRQELERVLTELYRK